MVVTIIVLIILAGVSISLVLGENGIVTKAKEAKQTYGEEAIREKVTLILSEYVTDNYDDDKDLNEYLQEQKKKGKIEDIEDNEDGSYTITIEDYLVTIDKETLEIIEIEKAGPKPQISNIKIMVMNQADGTEREVSENEVEVGTPLKITFDVSFEEGTLEGVNIGTLVNEKVEYTTDGIEKEVSFIVTGKIGEQEAKKRQKISLEKYYQKAEVEASDIKNNPIKYYGELVTNYTCPSNEVSAWRIFHADEDNVYLIADDFIEASGAPNSPNGTEITQNSGKSLTFNNIINDATYATGSQWIIENSKAKKWLNLYLSTYPNSTSARIKAVAYMLDTNIWSDYYKGEDAEYAIGGSTIEMWCASYANTHSERYVICNSVNSRRVPNKDIY